MAGNDRRDNGQKQQNTRDEREEQPPWGCVFGLFLMGVRRNAQERRTHE